MVQHTEVTPFLQVVATRSFIYFAKHEHEVLKKFSAGNAVVQFYQRITPHYAVPVHRR